MKNLKNFAEFITESRVNEKFTGKPEPGNITLEDVYEDDPKIRKAIMSYLGAKKENEVFSANSDQTDDNYDALDKAFEWGTALKGTPKNEFLETSVVDGIKVVGSKGHGLTAFYWTK